MPLSAGPHKSRVWPRKFVTSGSPTRTRAESLSELLRGPSSWKLVCRPLTGPTEISKAWQKESAPSLRVHTLEPH